MQKSEIETLKAAPAIEKKKTRLKIFAAVTGSFIAGVIAGIIIGYKVGQSP
jgi:hypothetical protein